jgi:hypothetical protein
MGTDGTVSAGASDIGTRPAGTIGAVDAIALREEESAATKAGRGRGIGTALPDLAVVTVFVTVFLGLAAGVLAFDVVLAGFFGCVAALASRASTDNAAIAANVAFAVGQNVIEVACPLYPLDLNRIPFFFPRISLRKC